MHRCTMHAACRADETLLRLVALVYQGGLTRTIFRRLFYVRCPAGWAHYFARKYGDRANWPYDPARTVLRAMKNLYGDEELCVRSRVLMNAIEYPSI